MLAVVVQECITELQLHLSVESVAGERVDTTPTPQVTVKRETLIPAVEVEVGEAVRQHPLQM
jgi:hypothetical protein